MNSYLKHLKEDPLVYYVYQSDLSIYNIPTEIKEYIVIVNEKYKIPEKYQNDSFLDDCGLSIKFKFNFENCQFIFYEIQEWFKKVTNCEVLAWQCSNLNKKFIIKEYVKFILITEPIKLRRNFEAMYEPYILFAMDNLEHDNFNQGRLTLLNVLKELEFSNQIIDNHQIINFPIIKEYYDKLFSTENDAKEIFEKFVEISKDVKETFLTKTEIPFDKRNLKKLDNV